MREFTLHPNDYRSQVSEGINPYRERDNALIPVDSLRHIPSHIRVTKGVEVEVDPTKIFVYDYKGDYAGWYAYDLEVILNDLSCTEEDLYRSLANHTKIGDHYFSKLRQKNIFMVDIELITFLTAEDRNNVKLMFQKGASNLEICRKYRLQKKAVTNIIRDGVPIFKDNKGRKKNEPSRRNKESSKRRELSKR